MYLDISTIDFIISTMNGFAPCSQPIRFIGKVPNSLLEGTSPRMV